MDDERLASRRLEKMLNATGRVDVLATANSPVKALGLIDSLEPDVIFLDIKMPGIDGFGVLDRLGTPPPVVFTTAFDEHSLEAFDYFTIDYLLKPIDKERLLASVGKIEKFLNSSEHRRMVSKVKSNSKALKRIASKLGNRMRIIEVSSISFFYAEDKITFAHVDGERDHPIEQTLTQLESVLDQENFLRVHRAAIVNLSFIAEVLGSFSNGMRIKLRDGRHVKVSRSRIRELKNRLGL